MQYYQVTDTKTSEIFVAPRGKVEQSFLIQVNSAWEAENLIRKLNAKIIPGPFEKRSPFKELKRVQDKIIPGEVIIFESVPA